MNEIEINLSSNPFKNNGVIYLGLVFSFAVAGAFSFYNLRALNSISSDVVKSREQIRELSKELDEKRK